MVNIRTTYEAQATEDPDRGWMTLSASVDSETLQEAQDCVERVYGDFPVYMRVTRRTEEVVWGKVPK